MIKNSLHQPHQSRKTVFKNNFSQHLRAVGAIHPQIDTQFKSDFPTFDTEESFRKYYGKKVQKLIHLSKLSNVSAQIRCKILKSLWIYSSASKIIAPQSVKHIKTTHFIAVSGNFEQSEEASTPSAFIKKIFNYKSLKSLEMKAEMLSGTSFSSVFYKQVRTLNKLQSLFLTVYENQLIENGHHILNIKQLESIDLKPFGCFSVQKNDCENTALNFYTKLINLKGLKFIRLDLKDSVYMKKSVNTNPFLRSLSEGNLVSYDIHLKISLYDLLDIETLQGILDKVDLFYWSYSPNSSVSLIYDTINSIDKQISQAVKKIHVTWMPAFQRSFALRARSEEPSKTDIEWVKSFKELLLHFFGLSITTMSKLRSLNEVRSISFDFGSTTDVQAKFNSFFGVLRQTKTLEHLGLSNMSLQDNNLPESVFEEILMFTHLKSLEVRKYTVPYRFINLFMKRLPTLVNLEKLHLDITITDSVVPDTAFMLAFPEPSILTDLSIRLSWMKFEHGIKFIKSLKKFTHLKKLKTYWDSQLLHDEKFRSKLLQRLSKLPALEEVEIITEEFTRQESEPDADARNKSTCLSEKKRIMTEIKDYMEILFKENHNLEKFVFSYNCLYDIKYTRY